MTASNKPKNQKPNGLHDLGQIDVKAVFYEGDPESNIEATWMAKITNESGYSFLIVPNKMTDTSDHIQAGYKFREGYSKHSEPSLFKLCMALANSSSTKTADRQHGKQKAKDWASTGKTIHVLAENAIANAQILNDAGYQEA